MNDYTRAAILLLIESVFPVLQIAGVANFTGDEVAYIMAFIGHGLTVAMLLFRKGQGVRPKVV